MALNQLFDSGVLISAPGRPDIPDIQQTTLGLDIMGRFICNTWQEATTDPESIDVVVIGAGMYGGYCASKIYELSKSRIQNDRPLRVLVLEAGPFTIPEHAQNIPDLGMPAPNVFGAKDITSGKSFETSNIVWGFGWRSNQPYSEQAYCVGGKGVYWGGWCPRLTATDLNEWPKEVSDYLLSPNASVGTRPIDHADVFDKNKVFRRGEALSGYETLEYEIGVVPVDDFVFDPANISQTEQNKKVGLNVTLHFLLDSLKNSIDTNITQVLPAPIAVQTQSFVSGLFALDKYSSVPAMIAAARADHGNGKKTDLRMSIVPFTHVRRLECMPDPQSPVGTRLVNRIEVRAAGRDEVLNISPHCQVVLALSCIESTRLALESFSLKTSLLGDELIGRNFMVHLRSDISFKIEKKVFAAFAKQQWPDRDLADVLQLASLHIQCEGQHGTYQYQLYAASNDESKFGDPDGRMYRMVPDLDIQKEIADDFDSESISFVLRCSGEVKGGRMASIGDPAFDYVDLAGDADDDPIFSHKRAWVQFKSSDPDHSDDLIWKDMHDTAHNIARALAAGGQLTYKPINDNSFYSLENFRAQQKVGTSWHDSGTMWMGEDPATSVSDVNGHLHHMTNVYAADQSLFTTVGSANPVLTGLCLARKVADNIVSRHLSFKLNSADETNYTPLSLTPEQGWQTAPYNGISIPATGIIETNPFNGIGIYYLPVIFKDFEIIVEWKAFRTPAIANSGLLLRMPDPAGVNFSDEKAFDNFYKNVIEIQIDELGKNFSRTRGAGQPQAIFGDSRYKTGAIYSVAAARQWAATVAAPDDPASADRYWNVYQVSCVGKKVTVKLNGKRVSAAEEISFPDKGFIGFQFHTGRVQFRNLRIKVL